MSLQPRVFVLMPFGLDRDVYEVGIQQACIEVGAECSRVDEQLYSESMLNRIYDQIQTADVVVADMTGQNPNVFYEVGYAHAVSQRVVLLTRQVEDIPFDLKHYRHIVYGNSLSKLKEELKEKLEWALQQPSTVSGRVANSFWLGHDLLWVITCAADLSVLPRDVWYGLKLTMDHAEQLGFDPEDSIYYRLAEQERILRTLRDGTSEELSTNMRREVIRAAYDAIVVYGSEVNKQQKIYRRPLEPEVRRIWREFKSTGYGFARLDLIEFMK